MDGFLARNMHAMIAISDPLYSGGYLEYENASIMHTQAGGEFSTVVYGIQR